MKGTVYILQDEHGRYYIGSTNDLRRRLRQHNSNHTKSTRSRSFKLVLSQNYESLEEARKVERKIKKLKRKDYIDRMVEDGFIKVRA